MPALNILIVEDQSLIAFDIRETLEKAGHTITAIARNFREAVDSARKTPPDIAIVDIILENSHGDGITLVRELQRDRWIPFIYLTANSEIATFERARETNPAAYLLKPFRHSELAFQVELAYLNQHRKEALTDVSDSLYVPLDNGYDRIRKNDVVYLQANGSYVRVFLEGREKPHLLTMNLGHLIQYFQAPHFFRLSRSLCINIQHITRIESQQVWLDGHILPIPEGARADLLRRVTVVKTR